MALKKNGIYKGRIGNISFYERMGDQYAGVFKKNSNKPASEVQKKFRTKFQFLARFGSLNKIKLIRPYWHSLAIKDNRIGYNSFIQKNMNPNLTTDDPYTSLQLVPENGLTEPQISLEMEDACLKLQWECPEYINRARYKDQLYILGIAEDYILNHYDHIANRKDQVCHFVLHGEEHHLYAFWTSNEKWSASKLIYRKLF